MIRVEEGYKFKRTVNGMICVEGFAQSKVMFSQGESQSLRNCLARRGLLQTTKSNSNSVRRTLEYRLLLTARQVLGFNDDEW